MADIFDALGELLVERRVNEKEFRDLRRRVETHESHGSVRELSDRLELLEDDFRRLTLIAVALCEACVRQGAVSREQLQAVFASVDQLDGKLDGRLDPRTLWPVAQPPQPQTPHEFLRNLEERPEG